MHELSTDGVSWVRASTFPVLFTGGGSELPTLNANVSQAHQDGPRSDAAGPYHNSSGSSPPTMPGGAQAKWYYTSGGQQQGPVDFSDLQMLAGLGQLGAQDQVWTEGMGAWTSAGQIQGLMKSGASVESANQPSSEINSSSLSDSICRAARDSRGWAIFISIIMFVYSFSNVVFGILVLIVGARERSAGAVANGVGCLVHALVILVGGMLLSTYASRLGSLRYSKDPIILERALDALRSFWIFAGMYLVVILAFIVIGAIAVFAYGVTPPQISL
ncbi:MAG: DUF4339 domain-containing protein, partial [Candidatus Sulfotelmatobacter sp.]